MKSDKSYKRYWGDVICPRCKLPIYGYPALSRIDNTTEICSSCGTEEALRFFVLKTAKREG